MGLLDVDFEVLGPPEVAEAFGRLGDRYARAVAQAGDPGDPSLPPVTSS